MFQEAIQSIAEAEDAARAMRAEAAISAKQAVENAMRAGEAKVKEAIAKAEAECADMMRETEEAAAKQAKELASHTENKKAAIRAKAESSMPRASRLIAERIVSA